MNKSIINRRFIFIIIHVVIGFLMLNRTFSKSLNILLIFVGFITIISTKNKNQEALLWAAYVVGSEVLFRMSKSLILYETPKYLVMIFLITGMLVEKKKHTISPIFLIYILLLLFGIAFSDIPYPESVRTNVLFNLSGPILLGICAVYCYKRKLTEDTILTIFLYMGLPIVSMVSYMYFKVPSLENVVFSGVSNRVASGGYGPNQVATILGVGVFILVVHLIKSKRFSGYIIVDIAVLMYIIYRALVTLSRGGVITALMAIIVFMVIYELSRKRFVVQMVRYIGLFLLFGIPIWFFTLSITGGMLENRYTNKNARGIVKEDVSAGRIEVFKSEWNGFIENPFFGVGVGTGKFKRYNELGYRVASHNEMSRLLGEHGVIGLVIIIILVVVPIVKMSNQPLANRAYLGALLIFWFLTINHSAMRIAMPAFVYGLAVMTITYPKNIILMKSNSL